MDVTSPVAAPDASPSATVLLAVATISPPRGEEACRVAGDGVLECQQGVPLVGYAARRTSCVITSGWLGLLLCFQRGDEQAGKQQQSNDTNMAARRCMVATTIDNNVAML